MKAQSLRPLFLCALLVSCQSTKPYAPPPQPAVVESVEVEVRDFQGRPEAYATVKGTLTTSAAQLVDSKQSRDGDRLYLEVLEQTPRGATLMSTVSDSPTFETKIPLELLGLMPGEYVLYANGIETPLVIPEIRAETVSTESLASATPPAVTLVDEFIAIEDSSFVEPQFSGEIETSE